jgi:Zn-dependent protease with chaperone function
MTSHQSLYPATPAHVPLSVTAPSATFKKEVKKVMGSILLFFAVYLILIGFSVTLAIGCMYAGFFVIINSGHLIGIIGGLGIISIGIMVFIFLVKFIFSVKKFDESGSTAITKSEQPELFNFIEQLTKDTQTQFPKKIILSPEVNACVFYNDSFWSMLFPVRKNLQIGLGLVNSLTLSEFKAVMAHEFGHFSQRSMKLGSFVYNVNKAVYNMLYENKDFGNFLQSFGNLHWAIGIFVWVTVQIVKAIQKILQGMYGFINKNYMGLSREMEFHADAVAASVSGSNNCITALRKLEISDVCYQTVIQKANELLQENIRIENVYHNHNEVMANYAAHNKLPLENATPVADETFFKKFQLHKVNIKDQWASHPPREERETHLLQLNVQVEKDGQPAWVLFNNAAQLQHQLTTSLYKTVPAHQQKESINAAAFKERYQQDVITFTLPKQYNGFYDDRQMNDMDFEKVCSNSFKPVVNASNFTLLFNDEWVGLTKSLAGNEHDAVLLKAISDKQLAVKTFDYDGEKMDKTHAPVLLENLTKEIAEQKARLQQHEETIVNFFYTAAMLQGNQTAATLKEKYIAHFSNRKNVDIFISTGQRIMDLLAPLFAGQKLSIPQAADIAEGLIAESETLKPLIKSALSIGVYTNNAGLQKKAEDFITADFQYFDSPSFLDKELGALHQIVNETLPLLGVFQFKNFKSILEYQLGLYENTVTAN